MSETNLSLSLAVTIGSLIVHADEMLHEPNPNRADFDRQAVLGLLGDPAVQEWLESFPGGLLPVKRDPGRGVLTIGTEKRGATP